MACMWKEKAEELIEIEDDYSAETDTLRFSDDDQYAGYYAGHDDGSSSDSHNDEFEVTRHI